MTVKPSFFASQVTQTMIFAHTSEQEDLKRIYLSTLRPVLDYASPTYHPLLTGQQSAQLEALQKRASKIIFGFERSYEDVISSGDQELLQTRRENLCLNFARKAASNPAFAHWFPERGETGHNTRHPEKYIVEKYRTERMKKNPVTFMRTALNRIQ